MATIQKNSFGSVKLYARHLASCSHSKEKNYNDWRCPKWLYIRDGKKGERAIFADTPSWAEANRIAVEKLRAMDPDIAAALSLSRKKGPPQCFRCLADVVGSNGAEIW